MNRKDQEKHDTQLYRSEIVNDLNEHKDQLAKDAFGMTKGDAQKVGVCIVCKESVAFDETHKGDPGNIYSPQGLREYGISGICETCFDHMFDEGFGDES